MCKRVICLAFVCTLGLAPVVCADLVGWWKLDDGTGTVVKDSSGNGIDGNFVGNPKWVEGMNGTGGLEFDGTCWLDFGNPSQTLFTGSMPLSIALWIYPTNLGATLAGAGADRAFVSRNMDYAFKASGPYARFTTPGVLDYNAQKTVLKINEWQHVTVTFTPGVGAAGVAVFYLDGVETDRVSSGATNGGYNAAAATAGAVAGVGGPFYIGNNQWTTNQFYFGRYDDIRLYNHILTAAEVKTLAARVKAYKPNPADKATAVSQALFQWQPGTYAVFHNVYVGTDPNLTQANLAGANLPFTMYFHVAGLEPGTTYYWRVDETDAAGVVTTGDVWSLTTTPATAWAQKPGDGATFMPDATTLEWSAGMGAVTHDVYLSQDQAAVTAGDVAAKVSPAQPATTFKAANLERGKTYYWRVDEQLAAGTAVAGPVWSFSVRPVIAKTDPNLLASWKLDEPKSPFAADYSGNDYYGTLTGSPQWVEGLLDSGLKFNGTTDYVDCGTPAALYLPKTYTYSTWFKVAKDIAGNSGAQYLLCNGSRSDLVFGVEDGVNVNGDLCLHYYDTAPGFHAVRVGQTVWRADEWHMVTATKDAAGHKIYLDGVLKGSDTNTRDDNYNTTRMISLGARGWTNPKIAFFNGTLDDVRVYNRALSVDEIKQIMRGDPLIAWNPSPKSGTTVDFRDIADLSWSAGDTAAQHDVYFGQDKDAVKAADATSPLYQGRQTATSFAVAAKVEIGGGAYYWRVDEVEADGTMIHKGVVWSFTIPAYLIVDEFESYTDTDGERIYQTWIDGWTNGTGSTVGNVQAPFAEQTIVHSGRQSMPMDYNNLKSPFYSEAELDFAPLQDWTVADVNALSLWFRGRPANPTVAETAAGQYKIGACSNDIWGTADSFNFYYKTLTGDGSISAQVLAVTNTTSNWAKAGVMIRDTLDPASTYANMFPTPDGRRAFQNRPVAGGNAFSAHSGTGLAKLPFWVKVERKGSNITGYYSTDGKTWTRQPDTENTGTDKSLNPQSIAMGSTICIGLCVASNNFGASSCFGEFAEVTTTGSVSGSWQLAKVGASYSNDPDKLYVAVEDSAGKSTLVTYPDPAAVGLTAWTQWKIPLTDLAGVNLAKVKKLYLGVGDKKTPVGGATGRMYFDDIRVTK
ncbi:MAG: LamG domain-containing protein [Planctomycetes bacterium]|nr:LamG domain-containing protein [Planctomycetota bacterium]